MRRTFERSVVIILLAATFVACSGDRLRPGGRISGGLVQDRPAVFSVDVPAGHAVRLLVEQLGADLAVTVQHEGRVPPWTIDMRERGRESATLIADQASRFTVTISARGPLGPRGGYVTYLDGPPRPVSEHDRLFAKAEQLESLGKSLATTPTGSRVEAENAVREAAHLWGLVDDPRGRGTTAARLGDLHFARGQFAQAAVHYHEALTVLEPIGPVHQLAALKNNLGAIADQLGDFDEAVRHFEAALRAWAMEQGGEADHATTRANMGAMWLRFGDYQAALDAYHAALPVLEQHGRLNPAVLNNLGAIHRAIGDLDAASRYFERALQGLPGTHPRRAHLSLRLAEVALDQGDIDRARDAAAETLASLRASSNPEPIAEADALRVLGVAYAAAGRLDEALNQLDASTRIYESRRAKRNAALVQHHIGVVHRLAGRLQLSRLALVGALEYLSASGLPDAEAESRYQLGLVELEAGRWTEAERHLEIAVRLVAGVRGRVPGEYSRAVFLSARAKYSTALVDVLMRQHDQWPDRGFARRAFEVAERERARVLTDLIRESGTDVADGLNPDLIEQRRTAQRQLNFKAGQAARISTSGDETADVVAQAGLRDALLRVREADARVRAGVPTGVQALESGATLDTIRQRLVDSQTRVVRFALGDFRSYAWVVTPTDLHVAVLPSRSEIERLASPVLTHLRDRRLSGVGADVAASVASFDRYASALASAVLDPIYQWLDVPRWLVVTDGTLQTVPLSALPLGGDGTRVVDRHEVALVPSATVAIAQRDRRPVIQPTIRSLAVIGDAVYEQDDPRLRRRPALPAQPQFGRLVLARAEARWIVARAKQVAPFQALGFAATRETVLEMLGDFGLIHVAAHAVAHPSSPELSGVALSMYDESGRPRDGMLRLHEIVTNLRLRADLVVLSACGTAAGPDVAGEGIMGVARGFLAAGAGSVIGSLHTVREEPTFEFMKHLYSELLDHGRSPAAALRGAQLALRAHPRFADPYYWSPFVFIGDPR